MPKTIQLIVALERAFRGIGRTPADAKVNIPWLRRPKRRARPRMVNNDSAAALRKGRVRFSERSPSPSGSATSLGSRGGRQASRGGVNINRPCDDDGRAGSSLFQSGEGASDHRLASA
jgi:hypothetical protein